MISLLNFYLFMLGKNKDNMKYTEKLTIPFHHSASLIFCCYAGFR